MNETFPIKQSKFSNGEISPLMFGETSHPKFPASLRTCLNWLPIQQGALVKRSGSVFKAPVKDSTYAPRFIPFVFSDQRAFVLEFGNFYIRFYKGGKYVGNDMALHAYGGAYAGGYYELGTLITTPMLPYLKFSQVGDVITITYGSQAGGAFNPTDLKPPASPGVGPWVISDTPTKIPAVAVTDNGTAPQALVNAWAGAPTVYNTGDRAGQNDVEWVSIQNKNSGNAPPAPTLNFTSAALAGSLWWMPVTDQAHQGAPWEWAFTVVVQDAVGVVYESAPNSNPLAYNTALDTSRVLKIFTGGNILTVNAGYTLLYRKLYRRTNGGTFGWVTDFTGTTVTDDGRTPDYTKQPPKGTDPFLVRAADSYPAIIGYLDQRRLFAGSALLPMTAFLSKAGDIYNYDNRNSPGADTDAFNFLLSSEVLEQIRAFIPMRRGLLFTGQGEWAVAGAGGGPVSRSSLDVKRQSKWGSSWLNPIPIGTGAIFNTAKSNMVRDFYPLYGLYSDIWDGQDLSVMARHMFDLFTLKDWAFQSVPYPVVWAVRSDGALLSLTYQHAPPSFGAQLQEGIVAWAQHTTGIGSDTFESVCVVPEPPEDAVYVGTRRLVNGAYVRYLERFNLLVCPASPYAPGVSDVRYGVYLDCAISYDGHNDQMTPSHADYAATVDSVLVPNSVNPADYGLGAQVKIQVLNGTPFAAFDAANPYGSAFVLDAENALVLNTAVGSVKARITGFTDVANVIAELDVAMTPAQVAAWAKGAGAGQKSWALARAQIAVGHLAGYRVDSGDANGLRGLICLADGDVQLPADFIAGSIYLQSPAVVIQAGIAYNGDILQLDAWDPRAEIRNKFKNLLRVGVEIAGTRDMWFGKDFANLTQLQQRDVPAGYSVLGLKTGYFESHVAGEYGKGGAAAIRHFQPTPAVISSILREMRLGDS